MPDRICVSLGACRLLRVASSWGRHCSTLSRPCPKACRPRGPAKRGSGSVGDARARSLFRGRPHTASGSHLPGEGTAPSFRGRAPKRRPRGPAKRGSGSVGDARARSLFRGRPHTASGPHLPFGRYRSALRGCNHSRYRLSHIPSPKAPSRARGGLVQGFLRPLQPARGPEPVIGCHAERGPSTLAPPWSRDTVFDLVHTCPTISFTVTVRPQGSPGGEVAYVMSARPGRNQLLVFSAGTFFRSFSTRTGR